MTRTDLLAKFERELPGESSHLAFMPFRGSSMEQIRKGVSSMSTADNPSQPSPYTYSQAFSQGLNSASIPMQSSQATAETITLNGKNALAKLQSDLHRLQVDFLTF